MVTGYPFHDKTPKSQVYNAIPIFGGTVTIDQTLDHSRIIANPGETIMPGRFTMSADFRRSGNLI